MYHSQTVRSVHIRWSIHNTPFIYTYLLRTVAQAEVALCYEWMGQDITRCNPFPGIHLQHVLQELNTGSPISSLCAVFLVWAHLKFEKMSEIDVSPFLVPDLKKGTILCPHQQEGIT